MKKILLSVLALLSFAGTGTAQNLPSYVPADGLVGWWPFNGNANDESGNGNNGTVNGATLTADRFGNLNSAYLFEVNNQISTPYPGVTGNGSRTISFWFLPSSPNNSTSTWVMAGYGGNSQQGSAFGCTYWKNNPGIDILFNYAYYSNPIPINTWNHYCAVYEPNFGSGILAIKIYINGVLQSTTSSTYITNVSINTASNNLNLFFGKSLASQSFLGKLDDFGFWNRALSQQEINALSQNGNTNSNCLDLPSNLQQGLVGYWPFCGNAQDESGNGNNGTVNGATLTSDRFGNAGSAYQFDGIEDFINIGDPSDGKFDFLGQPFSISVWIKTSQTTFGPLITKQSASVANQSGDYNLDFDNNGFKARLAMGFGNGQGAANQSISSINTDSWINVTAIYNAPSSIELYFNGVSDDTVCWSCESAPNLLSNSTEPLLFGKGWANQFFNGSLDDIAIWNRALSQEEITQIYNQGICKTSITVTDTLLIHTGITAFNPVAYQNTLKVWPNPGNQDITLDAGNLSSMQGWKYKVSNALGQTVVNETAISQQQTMIDLSTWGGNGIYYLHLINPQGLAIEIKKIVLAP